jgi:hypothetical protein
MGRRGAASDDQSGFPPAAELEKLPYNVTGFEDELGGAVFSFLEQTGRAWRILTYSASSGARTKFGLSFVHDRNDMRRGGIEPAVCGRVEQEAAGSGGREPIPGF